MQETEENVIDYEAEVEKAEEQPESERWEPRDGKYSITFMTELTPYTKEVQNKEGKTEVKKKAAINLSVKGDDNKQYVIFMNQTRQATTTFQKLCRLAKKNGGKLEGLTVEVLTAQNSINGNPYWDFTFPALYDEENPVEPAPM